jgi:hypothetical protein
LLCSAVWGSHPEGYGCYNDTPSMMDQSYMVHDCAICLVALRQDKEASRRSLWCPDHVVAPLCSEASRIEEPPHATVSDGHEGRQLVGQGVDATQAQPQLPDTAPPRPTPPRHHCPMCVASRALHHRERKRDRMTIERIRKRSHGEKKSRRQGMSSPSFSSTPSTPPTPFQPPPPSPSAPPPPDLWCNVRRVTSSSAELVGMLGVFLVLLRGAHIWIRYVGAQFRGLDHPIESEISGCARSEVRVGRYGLVGVDMGQMQLRFLRVLSWTVNMWCNRGAGAQQGQVDHECQ